MEQASREDRASPFWHFLPYKSRLVLFRFLNLFHGFDCRKMPPRNEAWPGRVVDITYHEEESKLRLSDGLGTDSTGQSPVLIASEGDVGETIQHHK